MSVVWANVLELIGTIAYKGSGACKTALSEAMRSKEKEML